MLCVHFLAKLLSRCSFASVFPVLLESFPFDLFLWMVIFPFHALCSAFSFCWIQQTAAQLRILMLPVSSLSRLLLTSIKHGEKRVATHRWRKRERKHSVFEIVASNLLNVFVSDLRLHYSPWCRNWDECSPAWRHLTHDSHERKCSVRGAGMGTLAAEIGWRSWILKGFAGTASRDHTMREGDEEEVCFAAREKGEANYESMSPGIDWLTHLHSHQSAFSYWTKQTWVYRLEGEVVRRRKGMTFGWSIRSSSLPWCCVCLNQQKWSKPSSNCYWSSCCPYIASVRYVGKCVSGLRFILHPWLTTRRRISITNNNTYFNKECIQVGIRLVK